MLQHTANNPVVSNGQQHIKPKDVKAMLRPLASIGFPNRFPNLPKPWPTSVR